MARRGREIDEETVLWLESTVAAFISLDEGLRALSGGAISPERFGGAGRGAGSLNAELAGTEAEYVEPGRHVPTFL